MKLYIVRHGETDDNLSGRVQGWRDNPINEHGKKQAKETADKLLGTHFDLAICSPSKRTRMTLRIILRRIGNIKPVVYDSRIMEKCGGVLEGKLRCKMKKATLATFKSSPEVYRSETFFDVYQRVFDFIEWLKRVYNKETILIVMHGGPIQMFDYIMNGGVWGRDEFLPNTLKVENASVRVYDLEVAEE